MKNFVRKFKVLQKRSIIGVSKPPSVFNEPMLNYGPGSNERKSLLEECAKLRKKHIEIPVIINGKEYKTGNVEVHSMPADHNVKLCTTHKADAKLVQKAIEGALDAKKKWGKVAMEDRIAIFLRAADLLSTKYRNILNSATMLGQSKTMWQAEIDAAAEAIDFLRFNAHYASQLLLKQPEHNSPHVWNRLEYRPLEGFVAAIAPFNFTAIGANLACAPAQMGNVVLFKPSMTSVLSNYLFFNMLREAGLPDGVIQFLPSDPQVFEPVMDHPEFAGLHFTGSTAVFKHLWKKIGNNLDTYKSFPRIVGETGGKNFHLIHNSANFENALHNTLRSAYEYQGQKCSACSRAYVPKSMFTEFKNKFLEQMKLLKIGQPDDPTSFLSSVIDKKAFNKISKYIDDARNDKDCEVFGGEYSDKTGYFIPPTLIVTKNPKYKTMCEEIFGPVLTLYCYEDNDYSKVLELINESEYALTGAIFAKDREVIQQSLGALQDAAGNVYVNDKSTGAVVGQQPFGGARKSGTNDKAGSEFMLTRWVSIRTIKENFGDLEHWKYPSIDTK